MSRLASALHDLRRFDALAARDTPLARRDPRAKLLVTLAFVFTVVSFDRYQVAALLPLALFPAVLAAQAALPARALWRTLALAAPFALLVGLANPLLDRAPMAVLPGIDIGAGWLSLLSIMLRFVLAASAALVLVGGTGMHALCAALSRLGVPHAFATQLLLLHRYLFVLAGEALRLRTAYGLRTLSPRRPSLRVYGSLAGQLLLRAFDRARRVHQAMLARGFDGELRRLSCWHWRRADSAFAAGWCAYFVLVRSVDLPQQLGALTVDLAKSLVMGPAP